MDLGAGFLRDQLRAGDGNRNLCRRWQKRVSAGVREVEIVGHLPPGLKNQRLLAVPQPDDPRTKVSGRGVDSDKRGRGLRGFGRRLDRIAALKVREGQIERLQAIRARRDSAKVQAALDALTAAAQTGQGNLLALSIEAIRLRATVGEVSDALEKVYGRHRADIQKVTGVYAAAYDSAEGWAQLQGEIAAFAEQAGRRPRVMIAKLGQDGHDRGAKVVATAFADLGFDVDMGPLFQTPEECARQAIENDVHAVGVSTLAAGHKTLVPAILAELKKQGADDIIVFVGGVIPQQDYGFLFDAGVKGIYGPGTPIPASAKDVLEQIRAAQAAG